MRLRGFRNLKSKQGGLTLLEVGLAIVVSVILIAAATNLFMTQREKSQVKTGIEGVQYLYQAAQDWALTRPNFTGVSCAVLGAQELLPKVIGNCTSTNPWGGNYTVAVSGSNSTMVSITMTNVPSGAGAQLVDKMTPFASGTPTYASNTFTVTF